MTSQEFARESLVSQAERLGISLTPCMQGALEAASRTMDIASGERLRVREALEIEVTDADMLIQVEEARLREQLRWAKAEQMSSHSANDVPYPVPLVREVCARVKHIGPLTKELKCFYARLGTWDVPPSAWQEALELRAAAPMLLAPYELSPDATGVHGGENSESIVACEVKEWHRTVAAKNAERRLWGCFSETQFSLGTVWKCVIPEDTLWGCSRGSEPWLCTRMLQKDPCDTVLPVEPSTLRSAVHADNTVMITALDPTCSVWTVLPPSLLQTVPKAVWELNASGAFCLRPTCEPQQLQTTCPPADWECVICLSESQNGVVLLNCGHSYHSSCIGKWFRRSTRCPMCRCKCKIEAAPFIHPPMVFELQPWPMMPDGVIAQDELTQVQERVEARRAARLFSQELMQKRRQQLADRFACEIPRQEFFQELSADMDCTGPEAVVVRSQRFKQEVEARFLQQEAIGSNFTVWPINGAWPSLPVDHGTAAKQAALTARLTAQNHRLVLPKQDRAPQAQVLMPCSDTISTSHENTIVETGMDNHNDVATLADRSLCDYTTTWNGTVEWHM